MKNIFERIRNRFIWAIGGCPVSLIPPDLQQEIYDRKYRENLVKALGKNLGKK